MTVNTTTDYGKAKEVTETLDLHKYIIVSGITSTGNFRKYIRDFSYGKEFVTKTVEGGIKVTRLK